MDGSITFYENDERECGSCYTRLRYMMDPVHLSCGDIYCKNCAEESFAALAQSQKDMIMCLVCRSLISRRSTFNAVMDGSITFYENDERECGSCYTRLRYMMDPVHLSCGDIYCKNCAEESFAALARSQKNMIMCRVCWQDVKFKYKELAVKTPVKVKEVNCSNCKRKAIKFCKKCHKKLCEEHLKNHDENYTEEELKNHHIIPIASYLENPASFDVRRCKTHGKKLSQACGVCHQLVCSNCQSEGSCKENRSLFKSKSHISVKIPELVEQMRGDYEKKFERASDEVTRISKLEKVATAKLTENEDINSQLIQDVDRVVEKQIASIREDAGKVKAHLENVSKQNGERVAQYLTELVGKREQLNAKLMEAIEHVSGSHPVDIVVGFDTRTTEMTSLIEMTISNLPVLATAFLEETGSFSECEVKASVSSYPKSITFNKNIQTTSSPCPHHTIQWTYEGRLACIAYGKILLKKVRVIDIRSEVLLDIPGNVTKIVDSELDTLYILEIVSTNTTNPRSGKQCRPTSFMKLISYAYDEKSVKKQAAMEFIEDFDEISKCYSLVVALNRKKKEVHLMKFGETSYIKVDVSNIENPFAVLAVGDSAFLVTNCQSEGRLIRYEQFGREYKQVWVCDGLKEPSIICKDKNQNIFVASGSADAVFYTISPSGEKQQEFTSPDMGMVTDMAIHGDKLAVIQHDGIKLFTIKYGHVEDTYHNWGFW